MNRDDYDKLYKGLAIARKRDRDESFKSVGKIFPSSAGTNCEQKLRYSFDGTDKKMDFVWHGCENRIGDAIHEWIQRNFIYQYGDKVEIEKWVEIEVEGVKIRGKVDIVLAKKKVIEIKTVKDKPIRKPDLTHVKQVQLYLGILGLKKAVISYFKRENGLHLNSFEIDFDQVMYDRILDKFAKVIQNRQLRTDTRECRFCPYSWTCSSYVRPQWGK